MGEKSLQNVKAEELDIQEEEPEEEPFVRYKITTYPSDFTLEVLYSKWKQGEVIIPPFQRRYVWNQDRAALLIESFLLGLPVPNIFFYVNESNKSVVIDGQQRLISIFYFFEGYFGEPDEKGKRTVFKLTGLNDEYPFAGKTYEDIKETDDGRKLRDSVLRAMNVMQLAPAKNDTSIYHIFERLNTGGVALSPQEVRNCVFRGAFNELLLELNEDLNWRRIIGKKQDVHLKDVELILRIIALSENGNNYISPMKEFLNQFIKEKQNAENEWMKGVRERFQKTAVIIADCLGDKPFRPKGLLNTSVLDSVFTILYKNLEKIPTDLKKRYDDLMSTNIFVSYGTNSTKAVSDRLREVAEKLIA